MHNQKGFSLVEVIVVMVMLGVILTFAIPQMSGVLFSTTYRDSAQDILQILRQGRSQAVSKNLEYRVEFDLTNHRLRLSQGNRASSSSTWTTPAWTNMPESVNLRAKSDCSDTNDLNILFKPNGTAIIQPSVAPSTNTEVESIGDICIMDAKNPGGSAKQVISVPHNVKDKDLPIISGTGRAVIL